MDTLKSNSFFVLTIKQISFIHEKKGNDRNRGTCDLEKRKKISETFEYPFFKIIVAKITV